MYKKLSFLLIFLILISAMTIIKPSSIYAEGNYSSLTQRLDDYLNTEPRLHGAIAGVSVRVAETGEIIYSLNGDLRLTPASNLKLFTAASALTVLGENYTFHTELLTNGKTKWNVLTGNLYLRGKGDPTITPSIFDQFAINLKEKGIKVISGDVIADDSWYDDVRYSLDVPWSDETANYGAQISSLSVSPDEKYEPGTVIVRVIPGKTVNQKAKISISPKTDYIILNNEAKTGKSDELPELSIEREHGKNVIKITGMIPLNHPVIEERIAVWDSTSYALKLFKQSLRRHGIRLLGDTKKGVTPPNAHMLLSHQSMALSKLIKPFMKLSNNSHGDILIKEMGKIFKEEGTFKDGIEVEKDALSMIGIDTEALEIRDGSGISHLNFVTANSVTQLLYRAQFTDWYHSFFDSLPVAGEKKQLIGGTLRNRMKQEPLRGHVFAKTGTLTNVSSLSGYAQMKNGDTILFSILLNHLKQEVNGKQIEEEILRILTKGNI